MLFKAVSLHGGVALKDVSRPNVEALDKGVENLKKHIENIRLKIGAGRRSELISMGLPIVHRSKQSQST